MVKNQPAYAGDTSSNPDLGRSPVGHTKEPVLQSSGAIPTVADMPSKPVL